MKIGLIVPKESPNWLGIDGQSMPKNHIDMCKFEDEEESDYKSVADKLSQWVNDANKPRDSSEANVGGLNARVGIFRSDI